MVKRKLKFQNSMRRYVKRKSATQTKMKRTATAAARRVLMKTSETRTNWVHVNEQSLSTLTGYLAYDPLVVSEGTGKEERIGSEIIPTGLHIKGVVHNNGSGPNFVRIVVVKSNTRQQVTTGDFFGGETGLGQDITDVTGLDRMYWPIHKNVHQVLYDKVIKLEKSGEVGNCRMFNKWLKLGGKIKYDGGNTGSEQLTPRYHIVYLSAEAADDTSTGQTVEVSALHRFFYKDF